MGYDVSKRDMLPCDKCGGFFLRRNLYRHSCNLGTGAGAQVRGRTVLPSEHDAAAGLEIVLARLKDDDVGMVVRGDQMILDYGRRLFSRLGHEPHQHSHIREKMRELGRLLIQLKVEDPTSSLKDFIHPSKFRTVTDAVRAIGGLKDGSYGIPSLPLKIGHALVQCAGILKSEGLMEDDPGKRKAASEFVELYKSDWNVMVSCRALGTLHERRWSKTEKLPKNDDIIRLQTELDRTMEEAKKSLQETPSFGNYTRLAQSALTSLILFNRRRPGETERLTVNSYLEKSCDVNEDITSHLSPLERELCKTMSHIKVRGKRGRGVPMLLTQKMTEVLDLLVASRELVSIDRKNRYVFTSGVDETSLTLNGSKCISQFSERAQVQNVTATSMRKHIATMIQLLHLSDTELDVVARFMGHDIRTHREYYRLPERTIYAAKMSKLLAAMSKGEGYVGKTIAELDQGGMEDLDVASEELDQSPCGVPNVSDAEPSSTQENVDAPSSAQGSEEPSQSEDAPSSAQGSKEPSQSRGPARKKTKKRVRWTKDEISVIERRMATFITDLKCPGMADCVAVMREESALSRRSWTDIKFCTYNLITKHKRQLGQL